MFPRTHEWYKPQKAQGKSLYAHCKAKKDNSLVVSAHRINAQGLLGEPFPALGRFGAEQGCMAVTATARVCVSGVCH